MNIKEAANKAKTKVRCAWMDAKCWMYNRTRPIARWCEQHPEETTTIVVATATTIVPMAIKGIRDAARERRERDSRDLRVYDPKEGRYIYLRKRPSNQQWLRVEELERAGYSKTEACMKVGLL